MTARIRADVQALTERYVEAWNAHDAAALASLYTADADFIGVGGTAIHGRDAIERLWHAGFERIFAQASLVVTPAQIKLMKRSSAIVYAVWSMRGHAAWYGDLPVLTGIVLFLAVRHNDGWRFSFTHGCALAPRSAEETMLPRDRAPQPLHESSG